LRVQSAVERILRRIESTANIELVITALEVIEHADRPETLHEVVKGWEGTQGEMLLGELLQAVGDGGLQPQG
jgi:hypothetical protein